MNIFPTSSDSMVDIKINKPQFKDITISWFYDGDIKINRCLTSYGVNDGFVERVAKSVAHEMFHHIMFTLFDDEISGKFDRLALVYGNDLLRFGRRIDKDTLKKMDRFYDKKLKNLREEYVRK